MHWHVYEITRGFTHLLILQPLVTKWTVGYYIFTKNVSLVGIKEMTIRYMHVQWSRTLWLFLTLDGVKYAKQETVAQEMNE